MTELGFKNVEGWKIKIDPLGHLQHEKLGVGELSFIESQMRFKDLIIPCQKLESPKLHVDRLLLRNWIRFDSIYMDTQYTFLLRTKLKELHKIPLEFNVSVDRRILINLGFTLICTQLILGICMFVYIWMQR